MTNYPQVYKAFKPLGPVERLKERLPILRQAPILMFVLKMISGENKSEMELRDKLRDNYYDSISKLGSINHIKELFEASLEKPELFNNRLNLNDQYKFLGTHLKEFLDINNEFGLESTKQDTEIQELINKIPERDSTNQKITVTEVMLISEHSIQSTVKYINELNDRWEKHISG